jgi:hypothetical protein
MKTIYPAPNSVSIWVGAFASEDAFDEACDQHLEPKLRLPTNLAAICEVAYEDDHAYIEVLLDGFSGCDTFIRQASDAGKAKGIRRANAALVCYNLSCETSEADVAGLHFLGSFNGTDIK